MSIGVVVGRFQVDNLHCGHKHILDFADKENKELLIFVGCSPLLGDKNQPLDFITRKNMIKMVYPNATIFPISDHKCDKIWSENLDYKIKEFVGTKTVNLYCGRDGFKDYYHGIYKARMISCNLKESGTENRKKIAQWVGSSEEFRRGVIYSTQNRYNIGYLTTDCAVYNGKKQLLLISKKQDKGLWRFPGGFFDVIKDKTIEHCAKRELWEEVGMIEVGDLRYIGSEIIDDWRFKKSNDKIITTLFLAKYVFGVIKAGDDADDAQWFDVSKIKIVKEHGNLLKRIKEVL